jgi:hypothetical protein
LRITSPGTKPVNILNLSSVIGGIQAAGAVQNNGVSLSGADVGATGLAKGLAAGIEKGMTAGDKTKGAPPKTKSELTGEAVIER